MSKESARELMEYTKGNRKSDLVFKNANILLTHTMEIVKGDMAVHNGYIAGIGEYRGITEIDCTGKYISPGFIDSHLHLESCLSYPAELIFNASKCGTTTFIVDPHEAANVCGIKGIEFMLASTEKCNANVFFMLPSCVPCMEGEINGAVLNAGELEKLISYDRILGLGEVMDIESIFKERKDILDKLELFENMNIDGHAPFLNDKDLQAYRLFGVMTDHEASSYEYAMKERRAGFTVHIREGSAAKNLENIVKGIVENKNDISGFTFCTDDKHIEDIVNEGHISYNIRKSIELGIEPLKAYRMATFEPSRCYGLNTGMIVPGYQADLVILDSLENAEINSVYYKGEKLPDVYHKNTDALNETVLNTVNINEVTFADIENEINKAPERFAITVNNGEIITGLLDFDSCGEDLSKKYENAKLNYVLSLERYNKTNTMAAAKLYNFGIENGAIATTVSHDSHNIIVVGDNAGSIKTAINELKKNQGGFCLVNGNTPLNTVKLPIMGLMTYENAQHLQNEVKSFIENSWNMGVNREIDPLVTLSFIALPVIPEARITPEGLYNVLEKKYYSKL